MQYFGVILIFIPVSYTHLDVYKRQALHQTAMQRDALGNLLLAAGALEIRVAEMPFPYPVSYTHLTLAVYPFEFTVHVIHSITEKGFETVFLVENKSGRPMPMCCLLYTSRCV